MPTAIVEPYAVVTVVDAFEGDAWVVDLRVAKKHMKLTSWNRFIIDTGPAHKVVASARGGPRLGLYRALFDKEPIEGQKHSKIDLPWQREWPWMPKICGVIITHTDQDHWGNARWLVDLIGRHLSELFKPLPAMNPLSVYTSPMVQWAIDLQVMARVKSGFVAGNAAGEGEDEDEDQPAAGGVDEDDEEDLSVGAEKPPPYCGLRKDRRQHIDITVIDNKTYLEERKAYMKDKNETRNGQSWLKWLESLAKKPSPILPGCKVIELKVDKSVRCMWNHRPHRLQPSISAGFRDVVELVDNLGYELQYRFNVWRDKPPEDVLIDAHKKQVRPANHEKRPTLEKWQYMHQTLPDAWLNQNVVQPLGTWSRKNFLNIPNQYDGKKVRILAEARLVPPRRSAKRSYHTKATELNQIIGGYWLRVSQEFDLGDEEVDDMSQSSQISSLTEMMEKEIQRHENNEASIEMLTEEEEEERRQRAAQKAAQEIMDEVDQDPDPKFRENPKCLGYRDKSYSMQYDVEQPSLRPTESLYKESYMGSAGTRFSRDFLHMAVQRFLSHAGNEPWYQRALWDVAMAQDQNVQDLKAALAKKRKDVATLQRVPAQNRTQEQNDAIKKKKLERAAADTKFKAAKKPYDDEKAPYKKKIEAAKHSSWGHAANRASLITHFRFHADWSMVPSKFDMLFTGDAFETGSKDSGPYAPHLKPSDTDFSAAWAARPRTIEMPDEGYMANPDGNLLGWLWQHSALKPLRVGVLKLPHHGSSTTTSNLFYRLVSASVYLVSGSNSKFGHPTPETLASIVETIMREDGPAKPPRQYRSVLNNLPKTYKDTEGKEFSTPVIYERPRPRLIFVTWSTCKEKRPTGQEKEDVIKLLKERLDKANKWDPNSTPMDLAEPDDGDQAAVNKEVKEWKEKKKKLAASERGKVKTWLRNNRGVYQEQCDANHMPRPGPLPNLIAKGDVDVQDFVYFHGRHLGGFGDYAHAKMSRGRGRPHFARKARSETIPRANVRFFVQKQVGAASRLIFGHDESQPGKLRTEWLPDDWDEIRADTAPADPMDDPVAYPMPGERPKWDTDPVDDSQLKPQQPPTRDYSDYGSEEEDDDHEETSGLAGAVTGEFKGMSMEDIDGMVSRKANSDPTRFDIFSGFKGI